MNLLLMLLGRGPRYEVIVYKGGLPTQIGKSFRRARPAIDYAVEASARAKSLGIRALYGVERVR